MADEIKLNETVVKVLPVPAKGSRIHYFAGAKIQGAEVPRGFGVRVTHKGVRSFVLRYWNPTEHLIVIGQFPDWKPAIAVDRARELRRDIDNGKDPLADRAAERRRLEAAAAASANTIKAIFEDYLVTECGMTRDEDGNATWDGRKRSGPQKLDVFERFAYPAFGDVDVNELKRSHIVKMLDKIAAENGEVMADRALAHVRRALNWYASRTDDYVSPIVKGMARTKPKERAGTRLLADDEIRDIFTVLARDDVKGIPRCFGRLQRTLFFAAARRTEASAMAYPEIGAVSRDDEFRGDVWTVPGARMKLKLDHGVPLNAALKAEIGEPAVDAAGPYVFSTDGGRTSFSGYDKAKKALDRGIAALRKREGRPPMAPWTMQRDVRRTARTLMSRAGVQYEIGERVLAHAVPGVGGVYDRWAYLPQKLDALNKLASLIARIVEPPAGNVEAIEEHRMRRHK